MRGYAMLSSIHCLHVHPKLPLMLGVGCALAACASISGCTMPEHVRLTRDAPVFDDVTEINAFFNSNPWLNFDTSDPGKINGVAVTVYLVSARQRKGVFGAGTIRVVMYEDVSAKSSDSSKEKAPAIQKTIGKKLHVWELPQDKAMPYRVLRRPGKTYVMGDAYQLRLSWGDLDLRDRRVAIVIEYERTDGQLVRRKPSHLHVPRSA